jgi:transposase
MKPIGQLVEQRVRIPSRDDRLRDRQQGLVVRAGGKFRAQGVPLAVTSTGSNVPDVKEVLHVVDEVPPVRGKVGHPRKRPEQLYADRAYDSDPHRQKLRAHGMDPKIARRRTEHGSGLGIYRWVVERTVSWLHSFRRLRLRTDRN